MKKIVLAFDSFKGSVSSDEIVASIEQVVRRIQPACEVVSFPIADGGEGTTAAICKRLDMKQVVCQVHDSLMYPIEAVYGCSQDNKMAVLELAEANGLPSVPLGKRNPLEKPLMVRES